jgi:hypothetical protein
MAYSIIKLQAHLHTLLSRLLYGPNGLLFEAGDMLLVMLVMYNGCTT